jgi:hypothetical protein
VLESGFFGPPLLSVRQAPDEEGFELLVQAEAGRTVEVQVSADLVTWETLLTFQNRQAATLFLDTEAPLYPWRFYRVVIP